MSDRQVVIIGGGITGLSAAFRLQTLLKGRADGDTINCTILESDTHLGGKIKTHREGGFVLEGGPDSMLARKPEGVELIRSLGLEGEIVHGNAHAHKTYILKRGQLVPLPPGTNMGIPTSIAPFVTTKLISLPGKVRALLDLFIRRRNKTDDVSLGHFLRRRIGNDLVDSLVEPLLAGIYAGSVDDLSLEATFPQFKDIENKHRSLIIGSMAQRTKAVSPSLKSGRSAFITLKTGLQTLIERLYDELSGWADIRLEAPVTQIAPRTDGLYDVWYHYDGTTEKITADSVIITTPSFETLKLIPHGQNGVTEALNAIRHVSTATVILAYNKDEIDIELDASGFLVPRREGKAITACTWVSSKWPHTTPSEYVVLRCYVGRAGQEDGLSLSDEDMVKVVQQDLQSILNITAHTVFTRVTRWTKAMPQYRVHHLKHITKLEHELSANYPGLFVCGASYRGLGIPDCIRQGNDAAVNTMNYLF